MFLDLGLEKHTRYFQEQEIDLDTFSLLNNKDLIELGITTFGARRKMLLAISRLRKQMIPFSAAPGAERKSPSSKENW